jgi:hypothetical protein
MSFEAIVNIVMLVLGVVLFGFGLWVIWWLLQKKQSLTPAYALLAIAFCMIGFSAIRSLKIAGVIEVDKHLGSASIFAANNPDDPKAIAAFDAALDAQYSPTNTTPLTPEVKEQLEQAAAKLGAKTNLTVESKIVLAKTQYLLGHTNSAKSTIESLKRTDASRLADPKVRAMIERVR